MELSQEQIQTYKDTGFVVIKDFFDKKTMERVSALVDGLKTKNAAEGEDAKYFEQSPISNENLLVRIENVMGDHNLELTETLITAKAIACLTQLLDEPPVLFKDKVNFKLPGCRADKLHQDQAAGWNAYCDSFITMGIAVDENRMDNAALSFMNSGNYQKELMTEEWKPMTEDDPPYSPEDEYVLIVADPGDVIFFDAYVPHGSPPNTGDRSRRNVFLTFNRKSDGDMKAQYYRDKWESYAPNQADEARGDETFRV